MKFVALSLPAIPATPAERQQLRPIGHRTDRWQQMIVENVALAQMLDDYGWEAYTFPQHELHTEGHEIGFSMALGMHLLDQTKRIKVGPIGYVLPTWSPVRLAVETAWLDQLSQGRTIVGFARGYQHRWFNLHGQVLGVQVATSTGDAQDQTNRRVFEEVYRILKLCWADEAFAYDGEFYKIPYPADGCPWPAVEMTKTMGAPGEMGDDNLLHKVSVVPKPYQKPHPKLFQAFSLSEATARWCAREGLTPVMLISHPESARRNAEAHFEAAQQAGRRDVKAPGDDMGGLRQIYLANSRAEALALADQGIPGYGWRTFWGHYGFYEAFRLPGQEGDIPWTLDSMEVAHYLYAGTVDDIKRKLEAEVSGGRFVLGVGTAPPEWNEKWHGLTYRKPVTRMREYLECLRAMWTASPTHPVSYQGEFFHVQDYRRFMPAPYARIPIYLAAVQARMLQLAGSHADGWISGPLNTRRYLTEVALPNLQKGLAAAGRAPTDLERCVIKPCVVHQDAAYARALGRSAVALYATLPYYDVVLEPLGFGEATRAIRAAMQRQDMPGMLQAVTEEMLEALVVAGTPEEVHRQLEPWAELCDLVLLYCPPYLEPAETTANHEAMIAAFAA